MKIIKNEVKNEKIIEIEYTIEEIKNILANHAMNAFNIDGVAHVNLDRIFKDDKGIVTIIKDLSQ